MVSMKTSLARARTSKLGGAQAERQIAARSQRLAVTLHGGPSVDAAVYQTSAAQRLGEGS